MAAHYGGIVEYIWKRVSRFDFDKYWKMREYVVSHSGVCYLITICIA